MAAYLQYWGKIQDNECHRLAFHCLDAAAVCVAWLERDELLLHKLAGLVHLPPVALTRLVPFFCATHDLGKFSRSFQGLRQDIAARLGRSGPSKPYTYHHDHLGLTFWRQSLIPAWSREQWFGLDRNRMDADHFFDYCLWSWCEASAGHHGQPGRTRRAMQGLPRPDDGQLISGHIGPDCLSDGAAFAARTAELLGSGEDCLSHLAGKDPDDLEDAFNRASWPLVGLMVVCDWLASNNMFFRLEERPLDLTEYWPLALEQARRAVERSGLIAGRPDTTLVSTDFLPPDASPTPLQAAAAGVDLPRDPNLFLIEDSTGSGKTEAALILAARIIAAGRAQGLYFGLPTQATANAMFSRFRSIWTRMYPDDPASLVLAHGGRNLNDRFREMIAPPEDTSPFTGDEEGSAAQCAAWLADNAKKSLLAPAGVGTVDQAVAACLANRHQAVRMIGLLRNVLIVDEVHAYDPYLLALLGRTLTFQAAMGGDVILLSATLPLVTRRELAAAFTRGLGREVEPPVSLAYPLLTRVSGSAVEEPEGLRPARRDRVGIQWLDSESQVVEALCRTVKAGGCACWIRNTVDEAMTGLILAGRRLGRGMVTLFHARMAMVDRLAVEQDLVSRFGPASGPEARSGRLVVATQVVEQSLDIDFDFMVSDLAPMDLLLQRVGRLHRHQQRTHRPTEEAVLAIHGPEWTDQPDANWYKTRFPGAAYVYPHHGRLWRTGRLLRDAGRLDLPGDYRKLMEGVYGPEVVFPEALEALEQRSRSGDMADGFMAGLNTVELDFGYHQGSDHWESEAPTRLGPPTTTLRLARWNGKTLTPWAAGKTEEPLSVALAWQLSQVSVSRSRVAAMPDNHEPSLAGAIHKALRNMPDGRRADMIIIPLTQTPDGRWRAEAANGRGEAVTVTYSPQLGLEFGTGQTEAG